MAQHAQIGLSNPYAGRPAETSDRPGRGRPAFARMAVLAGLSGAAAVGLGAGGTTSAWADSPTAASVSRWDGTDVTCLRLREPVMDGAPAGTRHPHLAIGRTGVVDGSRAWPLRCGSPPWARPAPAPVDPGPGTPDPGGPAAGDPIDGPQVVSVEGTVADGVEPGCVVLSGGDGRQWTLTGPLRTLPHEVALEVTGSTVPGRLSTCMQGEPLEVRTVRLLDPGEEAGPAVPIATTDRFAVDAQPVPVSPGRTVAPPACGPVVTGKVPSVALCTR